MSPDQPRPPTSGWADEPTTNTPAAAGTGADDEPTTATPAASGAGAGNPPTKAPPTSGDASGETAAPGPVRPTTIAPGTSLPTWLDEPPVSAEETQARDREAKAAKKAEKKAAKEEKKANRTKPPLLRRIHPVVYTLAGLVILLAVYYAVVLASDGPKTSTDVPTTSTIGVDDSTVRLDVRVEQIDPSRQTMQVFLLPVPVDESVQGEDAGELGEDLRVEVLDSSLTPTSYTFPANSTIDEVSTTVALEAGPESYPFDEPSAAFRIRVAGDESGEPVPATVQVTNTTGTFDLTADIAGGSEDISVDLRGERDTLTVALVILQLVTIILSAIIALVVVALALARKRVELAVVIWLGATLIAFPALRNAMPDAPPIGTTIDYLILFPCTAIIAFALLVSALVLLWQRPSKATDDDAGDAGDAGDAEPDTPEDAADGEARSSSDAEETKTPDAAWSKDGERGRTAGSTTAGA